jgi:hypothetical protein
MTERSVPQQIRSGLAEVYRLASDYEHIFANDSFELRDIEWISELPIGTTVLVLREQESDAQWAPVIFNERAIGTSSGTACFSWIHPDTIRMYEPLHSSVDIKVGHCKNRGSNTASHTIGHSEPGSRWYQGSLILDARWSGRGNVDEQCSGYCAAVMVHTALSATRMHDIFRFAAERVEGSIVCARGKHRSVAAGKILELCFQRNVDYRFAARNHHCPCNNEGTANHVYNALRALSPPRHARSLAQAMEWTQ